MGRLAWVSVWALVLGIVSGSTGASAQAEGSDAGDAAAEPPEQASPPQSTEDEARMHFRLGRAYYDSGRFLEAAREFEQSAQLSNRNGLYYNIFLAYRDAGDLANAIGALETYLDRVEDIPERAQLEARLATMRRLHEQTQANGGETNTETGTVETETETESTEGTATEPVGPVTAPTDVPAPEPGPWTTGYAIAGGGGALILGGVITGIMALGAEGDLEDRCTERPDGTWACPEGSASDADRGRTLAVVTDVLIGVGAAVAVTGIVLAFVLDGPTPDAEASQVRPALACGPRGCRADLEVTF